MNNTIPHQKLVDDILFHVGSKPWARCWVRVVGFDSSRNIRYGIVGETDIDGIIIGGRRLCIEVKTGSGKLSRDQKTFRMVMENFGALYIEARDTDGLVSIVRKVSDAVPLEYRHLVGASNANLP